MNETTPDNMRRLLQLPEASFEPVVGGFTPIEKFIVSAPDHDQFFIKAADRLQHPIEATVLDHEAGAYRLLGKVGLTGNIFPAYHDYRTADKLSILMIDYLPNLTWGGPWTMHTLELIDQTLQTLHNAPVSSDTKAELGGIVNSLSKALRGHETDVNEARRQKLFAQSWSPQQATFTNDLDQTIFKTTNHQLPAALAEQVKIRRPSTRLILADVNFGNIGFDDSRAYLVDPAYLRIGHPQHDRAVLGINILNHVSKDSDIANEARHRFVTDLPTLARLTMYWVSCTQISPKITDSEWGKFQQSCAQTALAECERLLAA